MILIMRYRELIVAFTFLCTLYASRLINNDRESLTPDHESFPAFFLSLSLGLPLNY